jgi:hypothetical protein
VKKVTTSEHAESIGNGGVYFLQRGSRVTDNNSGECGGVPDATMFPLQF